MWAASLLIPPYIGCGLLLFITGNNNINNNDDGGGDGAKDGEERHRYSPREANDRFEQSVERAARIARSNPTGE